MFKPTSQKPTKSHARQANTQISLLISLFETLGPWLPTERPVKTAQADLSVLGAHGA